MGRRGAVEIKEGRKGARGRGGWNGSVATMGRKKEIEQAQGGGNEKDAGVV
jgi:hypothetical protein